MVKLPTPKLTQVLHDAVARHAPPKSGFFRPKPKYAHQGGSNPPIIVVHGNHLEGVNDSYKRYLENTFREYFQLMGTPLRVEFKAGSNPFEGKKAPPPTERDLKKARRDHRWRRRAFG
jgi:GTP-binding protein